MVALKHDDIPASALRELMSVDPETGILSWKVAVARGIKPGTQVTCVHNKSGRRTFGLFGKRYLASRAVFALTHGRWPALLIDHINGNTSDDRPSNLREADYHQNTVNCPATSNRNKLGIRGVQQVRRRYQAKIEVKGKTLHLGMYATAEEAGEAYVAAAKKYFGEFTRVK